MEFRQLDGCYKRINKSVEHGARSAASRRGNTQPSTQQGTGKAQGGGERGERGGVAVRALVMFGFGLATAPKSMQHSTRHIHLPHSLCQG